MIYPMGNPKLFIFSIFLPFFLFIIISLYKHHQIFSSLRIELHQLKSRVSALESSWEKSDQELRSKGHDIAHIEKMILEKEENIASLKNTIDSFQEKGSVDAKGQIYNAPPSQVAGDEKQAYDHSSKNTFVPPVAKLHGSAKSFMKELYMFTKPYTIQIASVTKIYLGKVLVSLGKIIHELYVFTKPYTIQTASMTKIYLRKVLVTLVKLYMFTKPYAIQIASVTKIYLGKVLVSLGKKSMPFLSGFVGRLNDFFQELAA